MFLRYLLLAGLLASSAAVADPIPVADFARSNQFSNPHLSPDGKHLAVTVREKDGDDDVWRLAIYRVADMQIASLMKMPKYELPANYLWTDNTRLVVAKGKVAGSLDKAQLTGEIIATDVDGKNQAYVFGHEHADSLRVRAKGQDEAYGVLDGVPNPRNGHFYMRAYPWGNDKRSMLYEMETKEGGTRKLIADIGVPDLEFTLHQDGVARFAWGENEDNEFVAYRKDDDGDWKKLDLGAKNARFAPVALSPDNKDVFAYYSADGGPLGLVRQSMSSGERTLLASDAFASVGSLQWGGTPEQPFAADIGAGAPQLTYFDAQRPEAQLHKALSTKFAGSALNLISSSVDNGKFLFGVASDRDPGSYYLFEPQAKRMVKLFSTMPWFDPTRMAERRPIRFKASDGMELAGFLTLPPGHEARNLPLVLLPHGGPHGVDDGWFFDDDAQFLASRGYAVLQVNFRGSGGRGVNFEQAGYLKWGTRIQDDLLDGVRWAIKEGTVDAKRVCVYGASFGGYSAMMTAIRAPDLIKCAVGYAGVYDLAMMHDKGDTQASRSGRNYLDEVIGKDPAELKANSPVNLVEKLKAPVLIVHGEADERAPFAHAKALRKALDAAHKPYEWFAVPKEGHGFYTEEHRRQFYEKLEAFLARHLAP